MIAILLSLSGLFMFNITVDKVLSIFTQVYSVNHDSKTLLEELSAFYNACKLIGSGT